MVRSQKATLIVPQMKGCPGREKEQILHWASQAWGIHTKKMNPQNIGLENQRGLTL